MSIQTAKYNPGFLTEEDLVQSFVVRHTDLELIIQVLRENVTESNQHILVTGGRGMGKTTLALRVVAEVNRTKELRERWHPLVFAEESYQVSTPGEFWLEALFHLGEQTNDERRKRTYEELRNERDEHRLRESALAQLMDFADAEGKRLLLVVENFDMLLGDQISNDGAWTLRHTLLNEPRMMLLATAVSRFDEIQNHAKAMFELFKPHKLHPLSMEECGAVWLSITGDEPTDGRIRPIQILTGGNPRLVMIISSFAARLSFDKLLTDLMHLVDEHTEYFKNHLDNLPATERRVYLGLADLWRPATAREVAAAVRLDVNKTSSLLRRLEGRGAVTVSDETGRKKSYHVAERMYNIYYLMRRRAGESGRVQALVNFMVGFYPPRELVDVTTRIAREACTLEPESRREHLLAYEAIFSNPAVKPYREKILDATPRDFFEGADLPASIKDLGKRKEWEQLEPELLKLVKETDVLTAESDGLKEAIELCQTAIDLDACTVLPQVALACVYERSGDYEQAEKMYTEAVEADPRRPTLWAEAGTGVNEQDEHYTDAEGESYEEIELDPAYAMAWGRLGQLLHEHLGRYVEADEKYRMACKIDPTWARPWGKRGHLLHEHLERYDEGEQAYRKAIELEPEVSWGWGQLGMLLHDHLERYEEAEEAYRKAVELDPRYARAWVGLGQLLHEHLERYDEGEQAYRKAIELEPEVSWGWYELGRLLHERLERYDEAEVAYRKAIELDPEYGGVWGLLGLLFHEQLHRYEEAEEAYRKAIEFAPTGALWARTRLGALYCDRLGRYEEAEKACRDAIALDETYAPAWIQLGAVLHEHLDRRDEAEEAYRKVMELAPENPLSSVFVISVLLDRPDRFTEALKLGEDALIEHDRNPRLLAALARVFGNRGGEAMLVRCEAWAREAVTKEPDRTDHQDTLAYALCMLGKGAEALEPTRKLVEDADYVKRMVDDSVEVFVGLAAGGYAREALQILQDSPSAEHLEPLIVGLQLFLGDKVNAPVEITEVGEDVVKLIHKGREELAAKQAEEDRAAGE